MSVNGGEQVPEDNAPDRTDNEYSQDEEHHEDADTGSVSESGHTEYVLILMQPGGSKGPLSSLEQPVVDRIQRLLRQSVTSDCSCTSIDIWLDSPGGSAHAAYKLALELRDRCSTLRVVIPDYAKSAATLLVLAADEVFMAPGAELGPLDAQVEHPEKEGAIISALDVAQAVDHLAEMAIVLVIQGGAGVLQHTGLTRQATLSAMLEFAAEFLEPGIRQLDPMLIHRASKELDVAREYAKRLLDMRHQNEECGVAAISDLPRRLVDDYPTHAFVISRDEARSLGINAIRLMDYDLHDEVMSMYDRYRTDQTPLVALLPKEQVVQAMAEREVDDPCDEEGETACGP